MLKISQLTNNASVNRVVKLWRERYTIDFSSLSLVPDKLAIYNEIVKASSPEGRAITAAKLNYYLIELRCQMAKLKTNELYAYIPNIVNLSEAKRIAEYAVLVYLKIMEIYQQQSLSASSLAMIHRTKRMNAFDGSPSVWGIPTIEELAKTLEPVLLEFQVQHIASKDWRTLGFITTLLNFANKLLLYKLTFPEQVLLKPYFKFIEEQVALPWQRVCAAAAPYKLGSPTLTIVEQMFPLSREIAETVYPRLVQLLPYHRSRRGSLDNPGITHSCLRDLEMFQAYLWLCLLEGSMASVEEELVDLCIMVLPGIDVKWEMTELWNKVLMDEVLVRITPFQQTLVRPYTQGMQQAFLKKRSHFHSRTRRRRDTKTQRKYSNGAGIEG